MGGYNPVILYHRGWLIFLWVVLSCCFFPAPKLGKTTFVDGRYFRKGLVFLFHLVAGHSTFSYCCWASEMPLGLHAFDLFAGCFSWRFPSFCVLIWGDVSCFLWWFAAFRLRLSNHFKSGFLFFLCCFIDISLNGLVSSKREISFKSPFILTTSSLAKGTPRHPNSLWPGSENPLQTT